MPHRKELFMDSAKVVGAAIGATTVTLANVNVILTTVSISLAIAYTAWKWVKDIRKNG